MIPIDTRKLELPKSAEIERCEDGSVRIVRYTKVQTPDELLTMQRRVSYYGESNEYIMAVHLPAQRKVDAVATVAHTSANCWKMTISTSAYSDSVALKTLGEVTETLRRVFG